MIARHGLRVAVTDGWDVRIYRRPAAPGETTYPVLHAATVRLPHERGDYGSGVVALLGADDAFVAMLELGAAAAETALHRESGMPRLHPRDFSPHRLHRVLPGQSGTQSFFHVGRRAFVLYAVLGAHSRRLLVAPRVARLLDGIAVEAR